MDKDTFYFPHDYNTRSNKKIKRLIAKHRMTGYGVYWSIVEDLYNNSNSLHLDYATLAYEYRTTEVLVKSVIHDFDLFFNEGDLFGSEAVTERLDARAKTSKKAREKAYKRWNKNAPDMLQHQNSIAENIDSNAIKERKGKEIKGKEINITDVNNFFRIRDEVFKIPLSEYFKNNYGIFFENWKMKNSGAPLAEIFTKMDIDYVGYDFNNSNHILNTFKSVAEKIIKQNTYVKSNSTNQDRITRGATVEQMEDLATRILSSDQCADG